MFHIMPYRDFPFSISLNYAKLDLWQSSSLKWPNRFPAAKFANVRGGKSWGKSGTRSDVFRSHSAVSMSRIDFRLPSIPARVWGRGKKNRMWEMQNKQNEIIGRLRLWLSLSRQASNEHLIDTFSDLTTKPSPHTLRARTEIREVFSRVGTSRREQSKIKNI